MLFPLLSKLKEDEPNLKKKISISTKVCFPRLYKIHIYQSQSNEEMDGNIESNEHACVVFTLP